MRLLARVVRHLEKAGIRCSLIGAGALAAHGVSRSTLDLDLLTTDNRCLDEQFWTDLRAEGIDVLVRRGDFDDPLGGVVRCQASDARDVDLLIGKSAWQEDILRRAIGLELRDLKLSVVQPADLILLKLYAGGPQDNWDIHQLLDDVRGDEFAQQVTERVTALPEHCRALWKSIVDSRSG